MSKMTVRHQEYTPEGHCIVKFYEVNALASKWVKSENGVPVDCDEGMFDCVCSDDLGHYITSGHVMLLNSAGVKIWERGLGK